MDQLRSVLHKVVSPGFVLCWVEDAFLLGRNWHVWIKPKGKPCAAPISFSHSKYHLCLPVETEMWTVNPCNRFLSLLPMHSKANISILQGFGFTTETLKVYRPKKSLITGLMVLNPSVQFHEFLHVFVFKVAMHNWEGKNKTHHQLAWMVS